MSDTIEAAEAHVESMKKNFSLADVLANKVTYPTDTVDIFLDGASAYEVVRLVDTISDKRVEAQNLRTDEDSIAGSPEADALDAESDALEKDLEAVLDKAAKSQLTVTMKGVPSKVWRTVDSLARRKFPIDKNKSHEESMEENIKRNEWQNIELVFNSIVSITDADGNDISEITHDAVEGLYNNLYESEWRKMVELQNQLTFANSMFDGLAENDADFTLPSSPDEATPDTQN